MMHVTITMSERRYLWWYRNKHGVKAACAILLGILAAVAYVAVLTKEANRSTRIAEANHTCLSESPTLLKRQPTTRVEIAAYMADSDHIVRECNIALGRDKV